MKITQDIRAEVLAMGRVGGGQGAMEAGAAARDVAEKGWRTRARSFWEKGDKLTWRRARG